MAGASITICICPNAQSTRVMSLSLSLEKKHFTIRYKGMSMLLTLI